MASPESRSCEAGGQSIKATSSDLSATLPFVKEMRLQSKKGARREEAPRGGVMRLYGKETPPRSEHRHPQGPRAPHPVSPSVSGQTLRHLGRSTYHQVVPKRKSLSKGTT